MKNLDEQLSKLKVMLSEENALLEQMKNLKLGEQQIVESMQSIKKIEKNIEEIEFELYYNCETCEHRECFDCPRSLSQDIGIYVI